MSDINWYGLYKLCLQSGSLQTFEEFKDNWLKVEKELEVKIAGIKHEVGLWQIKDVTPEIKLLENKDE